MAGPGLEIFDAETEVSRDPTVRRGIAAVLGLAGMLTVTILGIGAITAAAVVGLVWLITAPKNANEFSTSTVGCALVGGDVLITVELSHGGDYRDRGHVFAYDWVPDVVHELDPGAGLDEQIELTALARQAESIDQLVIQFGKGEVAFQQTLDVDINVGVSTCTATIG